jgi:hypothetical protein
MGKQDQSALREQYQAPDLTNVVPDVLAYIERLEQGIKALLTLRVSDNSTPILCGT